MADPTPPVPRRRAIAALPIHCLHCGGRVRFPGGILLHGGWHHCARCDRYAYTLPFVGGGLVLLVEISKPEIHVLAAKGASHREVLEFLGVEVHAA